jgi:hypothetical protein
MRKIPVVLICALISFAGASQKTFNDPNAQKRAVSGYHAIEVSGGIDLYLTNGEESVAVSASETKFRDKMITEVVNGVLKIYYDHPKNGLNFTVDMGNRKLKAYVSFKTLDRLTGSGGSDISVDGTIKSESLDLHISGGSDFEGKVDVNSLDIDASGGSDVHISGVARSLKLEASGGSDLKGYELITDNCSLEASGGSDVYITVNKEMNANASGGSDIYYKGNGSIKEIKSSGSSSVKKTSK